MHQGVTAFKELEPEQGLDVERLEERDNELPSALEEHPRGPRLKAADRDPPVDRLVVAFKRALEFVRVVRG